MTDKEIFEGIKNIYDDEVNIKIETLWDGGYSIQYNRIDKPQEMTSWERNEGGYDTLREALVELINIHNAYNKRKQ